MAINETIVTGRKFRKLIDQATNKWQRFSFWGKAEDTEFEDGKNAETKVGAIDGITDSLVSTSPNIAASAKALSTVKNKLASGQIEFDLQDGEGFWRAVGADTWNPFTRKMGVKSIFLQNRNGAVSDSVVCNHSGYVYIFVVVVTNSTPAPYNVKNNGQLVYGTSVGGGCHALTPVKVKKGDTISYEISVVSGVMGGAVGIVYPI